MKTKIVIIILIILLFIATLFFIKTNISDNNYSSSGVKWNGQQEIQIDSETDYIALPGVTEFIFKSNNLLQQINLYNPEQNKCLMIFSITIVNETIWESDYVKPGYGFYEIELTKSLEKGTYQCEYSVRCFDSETLKELNGGTFNTQIIVR